VETLPVEYQPDPGHLALYREALDACAARVARAIGTLTETVIAERGREQPDGFGGNIVLASIARAGTPVGILMRRWAAYGHGIRLRHYSLAMVRGRGMDPAALRHLASHHDPADVVFVDGWTGRGVRARELAAALDGTPFVPELAALTDPSGAVATFGTRDDLLVPTVHLDSTAYGLVSRPVLRPGVLGPDDFHGAIQFRELASADVSAAYLDAITARFDEVRDAAVAEAAELVEADPEDRAPTWAGWELAERLSERFALGTPERVRPGVGETLRVLERAEPLRVLVRAGASEAGHGPSDDVGLRQVLALAERRAVPVDRVADLPCTCVGLIAPR